MFNIFKKKVLENPTENPTKEEGLSKEGISGAISKKIDVITNIFNEKLELVLSEFSVIREKTKNLRTTNYLLGLKHLENGKISEAIFRFRFTVKMWPDYEDARFFLAYCLTLNNKKIEAKKILEELLQQNPSYDHKAQDLLNDINSKLENNSN
jgi:tetratricopeptide (TPR) repeat protein